MFEDLSPDAVEQAYDYARERYSAFGVDSDAALRTLASVPVSMNCWQGDDVTGFEGSAGITDGGIVATGSAGGRARNADELRADAEFAMSLIPGAHRFNLHAMYLESDSPVDRDEVAPEHFQKWIEWAKNLGIGLDFNPTFFSHPKAADGFTLTSSERSKREFWIRHGIACRKIAAEMGRELGTPCVNNLWIPDGSKDLPADRLALRERLRDSLDKLYADTFPGDQLVDAVESKLFGIGSESFVVGSHEFYLAYALTRGLVLCMDAGHYHPTEYIGEKISSILAFMPQLLLHVSRPVRWDSDHVVILDDATRLVAEEIVRCEALDRLYLAVDFFDASINRITAWVTGLRATRKALLLALLEPRDALRIEESAGHLGNRLAIMEEAKSLPFGAVWDKFCLDQKVPVGAEWLDKVRDYESRVLAKRS